MAKISEFLNIHKKEVIFALIIFLVVSISFGAGYLANQEFNRASIIIEKCSEK